MVNCIINLSVGMWAFTAQASQEAGGRNEERDSTRLTHLHENQVELVVNLQSAS